MKNPRPVIHRCASMVCLLAASAVLLPACDSAPKDGAAGNGDGQGQSLRDRVADGYASVFGGGQLAPIKGLSLGMPIDQAVTVMNAEAGPIWAATLGKAEEKPFKVLRISGEEMQQIRLQLIQLVSAATMQLYRVDPADKSDIFIVVPSTAPDRADDLKAAGLSVLKSVLFTGFFAWADADGKVKLFIIGPTLSNALFDASFMPMDQFADRFKDAYDIPKWEQTTEPGSGSVYVYEAAAGPSVALAEDSLARRTIVVWDSRQEAPVGKPGKGDFD
jgi:hypothetical protein